MGERNYFGRDVEAMSFAPHYHRWILQCFAPYIGKRIAEVGAGTGNFSKLLLECNPEMLILLEPSANMFSTLQKNISDYQSLAFYNSTLADCSEKLATARLDTMVYVSVLEHINNDEGELKMAYSLLQPGGKILIFVPAFPLLFGSHDSAVGHLRRYTKSDIIRKLYQAGFSLKICHYLDSLGAILWFVSFKVLRVPHVTSSMAGSYDKIVVPILSKIESMLKLPFGKDLVLVGEKIDIPAKPGKLTN